MPQMSPMMWLTLYVYIIMLLVVSMLMMYYLIIYFSINFNMLSKNMYLFFNKW